MIGLRGDSQPTVMVWMEQPDRSAYYPSYASVRPSDYTFEAEAQPGQYRVFAFLESGGPEAFAIGSATVTGDVTGMVLAMSPAPDLTGRITVAEADSPMSLAGVHVFLVRHPVYRDRLAQDNSDAAGKLSFAKILPGHYTIGVDHLPDGCFVREVKIGGQAVSMDDVEVLASTQLEIVLSRTAATIAGIVSDDDGKPFPNTSVFR